MVYNKWVLFDGGILALSLSKGSFVFVWFKKLLRFLFIIIFAIFLSFVGLKSNLQVFAEGSQIDQYAKILYCKVDKFLEDNKNCPPECFDEVCSDYILAKSTGSLRLESKDMFGLRATSGVVLYRGVSEKRFAQEMKNGKVYIASGAKNVRGGGIYATLSFECASRYATPNGEVLTMLLAPNARILENSDLEKIKQKLISMDPQRFTFSHKDLIYNSLEPWIAEQFKLYFKEDYDKFLRGEMCDWKLMDSALDQVKKHPDYPALVANRKRYYPNKAAAVLNNSGLLSRFLDFDVLHSKDFLWDSLEEKDEEYLVLDPGVLTVFR